LRMSTYKKKNITVQCSAFNSDNSLIAIGTQSGFLVYLVHKIELLYESEIQGGVGLIDIFSHSNHMAIRGLDSQNFEERNKVIVYDAKTKQKMNQVSFEVEVKSIKITNSYLIVAGTQKIFVFSKIDQQLNFLWDSAYYDNPFGAFDVYYFQENTHICMPIQVREFPDKGIVAVRSLEASTTPKLIRAFKQSVDFLKIDREMKRFVAMSLEANTVRIFTIENGLLIQSLKRENTGPLRNINFSPSNRFMLLCGQSGDCEIFNTYGLSKSDDKQLNTNRKSVFCFLSDIAPYFRNEWSFASYMSSNGLPMVGSFASDSRFSVFSYGGLYQQFEFDILHGGDCFLRAKVPDYLAQSNDLMQQDKSSTLRSHNASLTPTVPLVTSHS
jgi:WD40 repeat protein